MIGSEQKLPGSESAARICPRKSPPKRGLWESDFLQGSIGKTHTQNLQILREDTLGATCSAGPFFGQDQKGYPQKGYPRIGQISPSLGHFIQQFLREISRNHPDHGYPFCRYPFGPWPLLFASETRLPVIILTRTVM